MRVCLKDLLDVIHFGNVARQIVSGGIRYSFPATSLDSPKKSSCTVTTLRHIYTVIHDVPVSC